MTIVYSKNGKILKYQVNESAFTNEDHNSFYLLGAYMADGSISIKRKNNKKVKISVKDSDWIESIRNIICPEKPIYIEKDTVNRPCNSFEFSNELIFNWLNDYGCTPNKSLTITINKPIPKEYQMDFIRGVIDGDGCMTQSPYIKKKAGKEYNYLKRTIYICSASLKFLEQIKSFIPDDINCVIANHGKNNSIINGREIKATANLYRLIFNDSNAIKLTKQLYYKDDLLCLERKESVAKSWIK